jgi:hypothetical protein
MHSSSSGSTARLVVKLMVPVAKLRIKLTLGLDEWLKREAVVKNATGWGPSG